MALDSTLSASDAQTNVAKALGFTAADIANGFNDIYNQKNNVAKATVVTAIPISDKIKNQVLKKIQTLSNKSIEIENIIDEAIIGGFILRFENTEYNASFLQRLNKLKTELI